MLQIDNLLEVYVNVVEQHLIVQPLTIDANNAIIHVILALEAQLQIVIHVQDHKINIKDRF